MDFTRLTALGSMFTMINRSVRNVLIYNREHDFDLNEEIFEKYITKSLILAILWSFSGDCKLKFRIDFIRAFASIPYTLQYFLEIFDTVLTTNANLKEIKDSQQRLKIISKDLFYLASSRVQLFRHIQVSRECIVHVVNLLALIQLLKNYSLLKRSDPIDS